MIPPHRLVLIPASAAHLLADLAGRAELQKSLGIRVPDAWPPDLYDQATLRETFQQLTDFPEQEGWWLHYFSVVDEATAEPMLVGAGGFKGPPSADGGVEISYSIVAEYRRKGYATEATNLLVTKAFEHPGVNRVIAETYPALLPSIGVLAKTGFSFVGEGSDEGLIRYQVTRGEYLRRHPAT